MYVHKSLHACVMAPAETSPKSGERMPWRSTRAPKWIGSSAPTSLLTKYGSELGNRLTRAGRGVMGVLDTSLSPNRLPLLSIFHWWASEDITNPNKYEDTYEKQQEKDPRSYRAKTTKSRISQKTGKKSQHRKYNQDTPFIRRNRRRKMALYSTSTSNVAHWIRCAPTVAHHI